MRGRRLFARPLFRPRPPERGNGIEPTGAGGVIVTVGFMLALVLTAGPAMQRAVDGRPGWPLLALLAIAVLASFILLIVREARSS